MNISSIPNTAELAEKNEAVQTSFNPLFQKISRTGVVAR